MRIRKVSPNENNKKKTSEYSRIKKSKSGEDLQNSIIGHVTPLTVVVKYYPLSDLENVYAVILATCVLTN